MASLYLVSTPIGNLEDITLRAIRTLFEVGVVLAEDTRRTGVLLDYYRRKEELLSRIFEDSTKEIVLKPKLISYHDQNEKTRVDEVLALLKKGQNVALVSDAGTPLVSDPGFRLVSACREQGISVVPIPGPSAWLSALVSSGKGTHMVWNVGYLPLRQRRRRKELRQFCEAAACLRKRPTLVFFESPHRLLTTLMDVRDVMGDVDVVLACELTKLHEKVTGKPVNLWIAELSKLKKIKGEYTVVLELKPEGEVGGDDDEDDED